MGVGMLVYVYVAVVAVTLPPPPPLFWYEPQNPTVGCLWKVAKHLWTLLQ